MRKSLSRKRGTFVFIVLSVAAAALNYVAYPLLARALPAHEYVDITLALSLFTQIGTFLGSLTAVTIGLVKLSDGRSSQTLNDLQQALMRIFIIFSFVFLVLSPVIMPILATPTVYAIPVVVMLLISIPITVLTGYFNGRRDLVTVGGITFFVALFQLIAGLTTATLSHSGVLSMIAMGTIQSVTLIIILWFFRHQKLPTLRMSLLKPAKINQDTRRLIRFTIITSIAIMVINLLQLADLVFIKTLRQPEIVTQYTDTYVISRVIFFAGMIFVWPFLSNIALSDDRKNRKSFLGLCCVFAVITLGTLLFTHLFGGFIFQFIFGRTGAENIPYTLINLSGLYKLLLLPITAIALYFVVIRSYKVVLLACFSVVGIISAALITNHGSAEGLLFAMNLGTLFATIVSIAVFMFNPSTKKPREDI